MAFCYVYEKVADSRRLATFFVFVNLRMSCVYCTGLWVLSTKILQTVLYRLIRKSNTAVDIFLKTVYIIYDV